MKADPRALATLLDVQSLDSRLDLLRHQLEHLPEAAELAELQHRHRETDDHARDLRIAVDDLTREQKKADADVEQVKARRKRDLDRIDQGLIANPKDLERMQLELVSLERRITSLEDTELDVMERLETAQHELDGLDGELAELNGRVETVTGDLEEKSGSLHQQMAATGEERKQVATDLPEPLMTLYERLRVRSGGVGAAALRARRCSGCRLELTAADLGAIAKAPADEVLRCEECNRILVRTSESGI